MKLINWIILGLIFSSCNLKSKDRQESKIQDTTSTSKQTNKRTLSSSRLWNESFDTLETIELPFEINQSSWRRNYVVPCYKKLGQNSIPSDYPLAIISKNANYTGIIIIVDEFPVLVTYDKAKNPIDELFVLDDYGMSPKREVIEYARINNDMTINLIDSIYTYDLDKDEKFIMGSQKFKRTVDNYQIDKRGIIKKIE